MKVILRRMVLLLPLVLMLAFTSTRAEVVKIEDYEFYQDATFVEVKAANKSVAGLTTDGRLFTWGDNTYGQLGTGDYVSSGIPTDITPSMLLNIGEHITFFDVGMGHMIAATNQNRFFGWGWNQVGEVGDNTRTQTNVPVEGTANFGLSIGENIIDIAAGSSSSFVLTDDGRYFSWGMGNGGVLGNNASATLYDVTDHTAHLSLGLGETLATIKVTGAHVLAMSNLGNLYGWGSNSFGELFLGDNAARLVPTSLMGAFSFQLGETISSFAAGNSHSVVTTTSGKVYTAGRNNWNQLGDGTIVDRNTPTDITAALELEEFEYPISVDAASHTILLTNLGNAFGWGSNNISQIGDNAVYGWNIALPTDITSTFPYEDEIGAIVSVGEYNSYVFSDDTNVFAWGDNDEGQIGDGNIGTAYDSRVPIKLPKNFDILNVKGFLRNGFTDMSTISLHSLVIGEDEHVYAWGRNEYGQLGTGDTVNLSAPRDINDEFDLDTLERIVSVEAGQSHSVALSSDNRVFTWGANGFGQLGSGVSSYTPLDITGNIPLSGGDFIVKVFAGRISTFLISDQGRVFAFGNNVYGGLGTGDTVNETLPVDVTDNFGLELTDAPDYLVVGDAFTFLVTQENRVYAVGANYYGQLGDGTTTNRVLPVEITSNIPFDLSTIGIVDFGVGSDFAGMLNSDGNLYMWGLSSNGRLGEGSQSNHSTPFLINNQFALGVGETIVHLEVGELHSMVLTSAGQVFSYGLSSYFATGTTYEVPCDYPCNVTANMNIGSETILEIELGYLTSFLISAEGNLYGFGFNGNGELGLGHPNETKTPSKITKDSSEINEIRFIYMQHDQFIENSHIYIELYFEYDIYKILDSITINGVLYTKAYMEEDVGKILIKIPNTYFESDPLLFVVESLNFDTGSVMPIGPDTVVGRVTIDEEPPTFAPIGVQVIEVGTPDIDWTTYIDDLQDNNPWVITLTELDGVNYGANGTYLVQVTAEDEAGNSTDETFSVQVIDTVPAVLTYEGETILEVGDVPYDILAGAQAVDIQDGDISDLIEMIDPIDYDAVGLYTVTLYVYDSSSNYTELAVDFEVVDTTGPTFDFISSMDIELGTADIDWTTYMSNIDDNSGEPVTTLEIQDNINYFAAGTYSVRVRATDQYTNTTEKFAFVTIVDTVAPICDPILDITFEVNTESAVDYEQYVKNIIEDSLDPVSVDWVDVVDYDTVDVYPMSVMLMDSSMNTYEVFFDVIIDDTTPPEITYIGPTEFEVGGMEPIWSELVTLTDNSGEIVTILDISDDVDILSDGVYHVVYTVQDNFGNWNELDVMIDVVDTTAPTFDFIDDQVHIIETPSPVDWTLLVTNIVENSQDEVIITFDDYVNYFVPGMYLVEIFAHDLTGNFSALTFNVEVVDMTGPELSIIDYDISVGLNEQPSYDTNFIAYDFVDGYVESSAVYDESQLDLTKVGSYTVYITVEDYSGNTTTDWVEVHVVDLYPPTLDPIDDFVIELGEGSSFDWLSLVENILDDSGEVPTVFVIEDTVDFTQVGTYQVVIRARDASMNYVDSFFDVMIEDTIPPLLDLIDDIEIGPEVIEITILDVAHNATDASMQITFDLQCPSLMMGTLGNYICFITATDPSGNSSAEYFIISIVDDVPPLAELNGEDTIILELGEVYVELGATCLEANCTLLIDASEIEDPDQECGDRVVRYIFTDEYGNESMILRTVTIVDTTPPDIELNPGMDSIIAGGEHLDGGVVVNEPNVEVNVTTGPLFKGDYDYSTFTITYTAVDQSLNEAVIVRYVSVFDKAPEVEFEIGASFTTLKVGDTLETPLCVVRFDGDPQPCVFDTTGVDTSTPGTYTFSASASYHGTSYDREITVWVWDFADDQPAPVGYWKREEEVML